MKAKKFISDCALVTLILLGILLICGIVNGEASAVVLVLAATAFIYIFCKRKMRHSGAKARRAKISSYSSIKRAA